MRLPSHPSIPEPEPEDLDDGQAEQAARPAEEVAADGGIRPALPADCCVRSALHAGLLGVLSARDLLCDVAGTGTVEPMFGRWHAVNDHLVDARDRLIAALQRLNSPT